MSPYGIIYKVTNLITNKIYIGQSTDFVKRKSWHKRNKTNDYFHRAIVKYGFDNFKFEIIDSSVDKDSLDSLEIYYINHFNSLRPDGYNLKTGGSRGKHNETTKKLLSTSHKTWHNNNPQFKQFISKIIKNFFNSEAGLKQKQINRDNLKKVSHLAHEKTRQLNKNPKYKNRKSTPIVDIDTKVFYPSLHEAARQLNFSVKHLPDHMKGKRLTIGGHKFRYATEQEILNWSNSL